MCGSQCVTGIVFLTCLVLSIVYCCILFNCFGKRGKRYHQRTIVTTVTRATPAVTVRTVSVQPAVPVSTPPPSAQLVPLPGQHDASPPYPMVDHHPATTVAMAERGESRWNDGDDGAQLPTILTQSQSSQPILLVTPSHSSSPIGTRIKVRSHRSSTRVHIEPGPGMVLVTPPKEQRTRSGRSRREKKKSSRRSASSKRSGGSKRSKGSSKRGSSKKGSKRHSRRSSKK